MYRFNFLCVGDHVRQSYVWCTMERKGKDTSISPWVQTHKLKKEAQVKKKKRELKDSSAAASFPPSFFPPYTEEREREEQSQNPKLRDTVRFPHDSKRRESLFEIGPNDTMTFPLYRSRGVFIANRCPPRRKENGGGGGAKRMCKSQFLGAGKGNRFKHIFYIKKFPKQRHIHINYSVLCNLFQVLCSLVGRILYQTMKKALVTFSSSFDG